MTTFKKTRTEKVKIALKIVLKHLGEPHFPRTIQTCLYNGAQIKINSIDEILSYFEKAEWKDCRLSVFGEHEISERIPNCIFIDLDDIDELEIVKSRIRRLVNGVPLVIFTGNGLGLILPIEMNSMINSKHDSLKSDFIANEFLRFMKDYLTHNRADTANHPSLKSCLIRIPYTINSKNGKDVSFQESWNGKRVSVNNVPFITHLNDIIEKNKPQNNNTIEINPKNYSWIENILSKGIRLHQSNRLLGLIVSRYLMNVKKIPIHDAVNVIRQWDDRYGTSQINYELNYALHHGKIPVGFKKFTERNPDFAEEFSKIPNLSKYNPLVKDVKSFIIENYDTSNQKFTMPNVDNFEDIGYSKTKDSTHIYLVCYDCNNRGAGDFEPHEKSYRFHENRCKNIRYLTKSEAIDETKSAKYVRTIVTGASSA